MELGTFKGKDFYYMNREELIDFVKWAKPRLEKYEELAREQEDSIRKIEALYVVTDYGVIKNIYINMLKKLLFKVVK